MKDGNTLFLCGKFTIKKRKTLKNMRVPLTVAMLFPVLLFSLEIKARTTGEVGPYTWAHLPAQSLRNPTPMSSGSGSSSFVGGIGGVTFDQTAKPQEGTKVTALSLGYDPEEPDAQRLICTINGKDIAIILPDWLMIPIVKYTDSDYYSCFTLFGKLLDSEMETVILENEGRVMNYHPAFENTLLGLRLWYMDVLLVYGFTNALPMEDDTWLLGTGETEPDTVANSTKANDFISWLDKKIEQTGQSYRSYIISDYLQTIEFSLQNDSLRLSGSPCYFFWKYRIDLPSFDTATSRKTIRDSLTRLRDHSISSGSEEALQNWTINAIIPAIEEYQSKHDFYREGPIIDLIALSSAQERKAYLEQFTAASLFDFLVDLCAAMDAYTVIPLNALSDSVAMNEAMLSAINPAVWRATCAVMRYTAFFRYCRREFPDAWEDLVASIAEVKVSPETETPTVLYPTGNAAVDSAISHASSTSIQHRRRYSVTASPVNHLLFFANTDAYRHYDNSVRVFDLLGRPVRNVRPFPFTPSGKNGCGHASQLFIIKYDTQPLRKK